MPRAQFLLAVTSLAVGAPTQCTNAWLPGDAVAGTDGSVATSTKWDPDGAGPAPPRVVIGGQFTVAGNVAAVRVATWDPATGAWSALGDGLSTPGVPVAPRVDTMTTLPNGGLVVGGVFTQAGTVAAQNVALWTGIAWVPLGAGLPLPVRALAALPAGDVVAASDFGLFRWDGTAWLPFGPLAGVVQTLLVRGNGELIAGGSFTLGASAFHRLARWTGTAWSAFVPGPDHGFVRALAELPNGDVVAGGTFTTVGGVTTGGIAQWNGAAWLALGPGTTNAVTTLSVAANGDVFAGGAFDVAGVVGAVGVARWNGSTWSALGSGILGESAVATVLALGNGALLVGGRFQAAGGSALANLARWSGTAWAAVMPGTNDQVRALAAMSDGDVVVGGDFTCIGGVLANRIARRTGGAWAPLGSGMNARVHALLALPDGSVLAGGEFTTAGYAPASGIARWDGTSWATFAGGLPPPVFALALAPNGDVYAGGGPALAGATAPSCVVRWNGTAWSSLASGVTFGSVVRALCVRPNGRLVAGGYAMTSSGAHLAEWDGSAWSPLGTGPNSIVYSVRALANGDVIAGGAFTAAGGASAGGVARWNGAAWSPVGAGVPGQAHALTTLPGGDLLVAGGFGGTAGSHVGRWNGAQWSSLGGGTNQPAYAIAVLPSGDVVVGGGLTATGSGVSAYFARVTTTCPATVTTVAAGCPSSGGANVLAAASLPWLGSTFRMVGTGLPSLALVAHVTSTTPIAPGLVSLAPGCSLLVSPELVQLSVTTTGVAESALALPSAPALVGLTFDHQLVPIELGVQLQLGAITATNSLRAVCGVF